MLFVCVYNSLQSGRFEFMQQVMIIESKLVPLFNKMSTIVQQNEHIAR
jgi:hypothetical protein